MERTSWETSTALEVLSTALSVFLLVGAHESTIVSPQCISLRRLSTTKRRLIKIMAEAEEHGQKLDGVFEAISPFHGVLGPAG